MSQENKIRYYMLLEMFRETGRQAYLDRAKKLLQDVK